jgi:hypothetical protein
MPIAAVAKPIKVMVIRKVYLRPSLSPRMPNRIAPIGRTPKPAPKVARVSRRAAVGFAVGKKSVAMTGARVP